MIGRLSRACVQGPGGCTHLWGWKPCVCIPARPLHPNSELSRFSAAVVVRPPCPALSAAVPNHASTRPQVLVVVLTLLLLLLLQEGEEVELNFGLKCFAFDVEQYCGMLQMAEQAWAWHGRGKGRTP